MGIWGVEVTFWFPWIKRLIMSWTPWLMSLLFDIHVKYRYLFEHFCNYIIYVYWSSSFSALISLKELSKRFPVFSGWVPPIRFHQVIPGEGEGTPKEFRGVCGASTPGMLSWWFLPKQRQLTQCDGYVFFTEQRVPSTCGEFVNF